MILYYTRMTCKVLGLAKKERNYNSKNIFVIQHNLPKDCYNLNHLLIGRKPLSFLFSHPFMTLRKLCELNIFNNNASSFMEKRLFICEKNAPSFDENTLTC